MSWSFSRELVEEYLGRSSLDTVPSAQSNMTLTPDQYYWPDKPTEHSRLSRFGMTCEPLMGNRGAELLTLFLEDFRARTFPLPEEVTDWTESVVDSGGRWRESLARYDQDTHSLKTAQLSLIEDWTGYSVTLPRSGLMLGGQCWELPMLGRITRETGSGFLPTPTVCGNHNRKGASKTSGDGLATAVAKKLLPTPTAHNAKETGAKSQMGRNSVQLGDMVGGKLNPQWVEWLMGWPIGHTDLKRLVTDKSPSAEQLHGVCLEVSE